MHNIKEVVAQRNSQGGVTVTTVSGENGDLSTRERSFNSALDALVTFKAQKTNAAWKATAGVYSVFPAMAYVMLDIAISRGVDVKTVVIGTAVGLAGIYTSYRQGYYELEAEEGLDAVKEFVRPGSLPQEGEVFSADLDIMLEDPEE